MNILTKKKRSTQNENQGKEINAAFSRKEFKYVLENLQNGKAGFVSISNEMIKKSPKIILDLLFRFLNLCTVSIKLSFHNVGAYIY